MILRSVEQGLVRALLRRATVHPSSRQPLQTALAAFGAALAGYISTTYVVAWALSPLSSLFDNPGAVSFGPLVWNVHYLWSLAAGLGLFRMLVSLGIHRDEFFSEYLPPGYTCLTTLKLGQLYALEAAAVILLPSMLIGSLPVGIILMSTVFVVCIVMPKQYGDAVSRGAPMDGAEERDPQGGTGPFRTHAEGMRHQHSQQEWQRHYNDPNSTQPPGF